MCVELKLPAEVWLFKFIAEWHCCPYGFRPTVPLSAAALILEIMVNCLKSSQNLFLLQWQ